MPYGIYIAAEGAMAQSARMEAIANNLANAETPGFKRDLAVLQARYAEATARGFDAPGSRSINDLGGGVQVRGTETDFSPGPMERTERPTDLAISNEGFFVVQRGNEELLTRAGNFTLSPGGALTTTTGYPVLSAEGDPVAIDPTAGPWHFSPDGALMQGDLAIPLAIVKPSSLGDLAKAGENLFRPLASTQPVEQTARSVAPGFLERSGVQPTTEMMEMIETSRAFEANVNLIRHQDQMLGNLLGRVLKV